MAINKDFELNENDLVIKDGDFVIAESDQQHIEDTINAFPGWWKENPADGVGVFQYVNSAGQEQTIRREIQIQLQSDNYQSSPVVTTNASGLLTIKPNVNVI